MANEEISRRRFVKTAAVAGVGFLGAEKLTQTSALAKDAAAATPRPPGELPSHFKIEQVAAPNPWNHLNFQDNPRDFQFAILPDLTGRERPGVCADAVKKLNLLQPEFVMGIGDVIEGHTNDPAELNQHWDQFMKAITPLEMPFFYVPGNHDYWYMTTQNWNGQNIIYDMRAVYKQRVGRSYFHFIYQNVLFLILNNSMARDGEMAAQKEYVTKVLNENRNVRWTFTFYHYPDWFNAKDEIWQHTAPLLADRQYTAFAGNSHEYVYFDRNHRDHINVATAGGMSRMRGARFGEVDHLVWVTMREDGPRIVNLSLDGIHGKNLRTETSASLSRNLLRQSPVSAPVLFQKAGDFQPQTAQIRVANTSSYEMKLEAGFQPHDSLVAEPGVIRLQLAPRSEKLVDVKLRTLAPTPIFNIRPLILNWTATQQPTEKDSLVRVQSSLRVCIDTQEDRPARSKPVVQDLFADAELAPGWVVLGPGGQRVEKSGYRLSDDPARPDQAGCEYTDGRGIYTLTPGWSAPFAGLYRDIPADSFDCRVKLANLEWSGAQPAFHWEFWDSSDESYHYGPSFLTGVILKLSQRDGKAAIEVSTFDKKGGGKNEKQGEVELSGLPRELTLRAQWRESMRSWVFSYYVGDDVKGEVAVAKFTEKVSPSPNGKRNLIYVRKAAKEEGFAVSVARYDFFV